MLAMQGTGLHLAKCIFDASKCKGQKARHGIGTSHNRMVKDFLEKEKRKKKQNALNAF